MHLTKNGKAVSTLILIIIILCSVIFGALISYLWVMGSFYLEPENSANVVITEADFAVDHADYFNITVMNPSHSDYGTNITQIYFTLEDNDTIFNVTTTTPSLPIPLARATVKSIVCTENWGAYAGQSITVHAVTNNASGATYTVTTEFVELELSAQYDATLSCNYFNVTATNNAESAINLTLSEVYFEYALVTNMTITLPKNLTIGNSVTFRCYANWNGKITPYIYVKTEEGYIADLRKQVKSVTNLQITDVSFNYTDPNEINITVSNLVDSNTSYVDITKISITYDNSTVYSINGSLTNPVFYPKYTLAKNQTVTFNHCVWPWKNYRDRNFTITVLTKQGFNATKLLKTPASLVFTLDEINFNLSDTASFSITLQNVPSSLKNATISKIQFINGTATFIINGTTPAIPYNITVGDTQTTTCPFDWSSYRGQNITLKIYTSQKINMTAYYVLPKMTLSATFNSSISTEYVSLTLLNKAHKTVNITGISINGTWINITLTYPKLPITIGNNETLEILCPFNWQTLSGEGTTIIVATAEGFNVTITVTVP